MHSWTSWALRTMAAACARLNDSSTGKCQPLPYRSSRSLSSGHLPQTHTRATLKPAAGAHATCLGWGRIELRAPVMLLGRLTRSRSSTPDFLRRVSSRVFFACVMVLMCWRPHTVLTITLSVLPRLLCHAAERTVVRSHATPQPAHAAPRYVTAVLGSYSPAFSGHAYSNGPGQLPRSGSGSCRIRSGSGQLPNAL
jgi:hypothetical protein